MDYSLEEKLAIAKALDELILADGKINIGEISYLGQLMNTIGFDQKVLSKSRKLNTHRATMTLKNMSNEKKGTLAFMLKEMAEADGRIDDIEAEVISSVFFAAGIDINTGRNTNKDLDLSDIYFISSDHLRYEDGRHVSGPHGGAKRAVKIENNIEGKEGYTVTVFNLDGNHPLWNNNIQLAPKQMKIKEKHHDKIVLQGYGFDRMGGAFSDYGITIHHSNNEIDKIVMHLIDRNIDIEYHK